MTTEAAVSSQVDSRARMVGMRGGYHDGHAARRCAPQRGAALWAAVMDSYGWVEGAVLGSVVGGAGAGAGGGAGAGTGCVAGEFVGEFAGGFAGWVEGMSVGDAVESGLSGTNC